MYIEPYPDGTKFIVIELQKHEDGTVGNLVWAYDNQNTAENKFYTVLAAAAISNIPKHSAVLLHEDGFVIRNETYIHESNEE